MKKFTTDGFLADEINAWVKKYHSENKDLFEHCNKLNILSHLTIEQLLVKNENGQELIASALFVRLLSQFQSVIVLIERGLINESKIILRTMLDGLFVLVAVVKEEKYVNYYINDDIEKRIEYLKRFSQNIGNHFDDIRQQLPNEEIDNLLNELKEQKSQREVQGSKFSSRLSTKKWAEFSEMEGLYYRLYSQFNSSVHGLSRELEQYATVNDEGEITGMNWGPDIEGVDIVLTTASDFLCRAQQSINNLFGLDNSEVEEYWKKTSEFEIKSHDMRIKSFGVFQ